MDLHAGAAEIPQPYIFNDCLFANQHLCWRVLCNVSQGRVSGCILNHFLLLDLGANISVTPTGWNPRDLFQPFCLGSSSIRMLLMPSLRSSGPCNNQFSPRFLDSKARGVLVCSDSNWCCQECYRMGHRSSLWKMLDVLLHVLTPIRPKNTLSN